MPPKLTHLEFDKTNPIHLQTLAAIWNEASGQALSISVKFASHNIKPSRGGSQSGRFVLVDGEPAGVVLASLLHDEPSVMSPELGWIDVLAVRPAKQQQGLGATLLKWAEEWLQSEGCRGCVLGSSLRPFVPGVPIELNSPDYFTRRGYSKDDVVWDVAANLATYQPPSTVREIDGVVRPAQPGQEADLLGFLQREFAGRWRYECQEFLRDPHCRFSDYMLLWTARGVDGFCVLTFEDSGQPIERFYPYQLPRPWGQLGSVGVSADRRGQGYGAALLDAGLRRLHNNGVNGCVIDWTTIVDFYGKFGFTPYRAYQQMYKSL